MLPAERDSKNLVREEYPNTVAAFVSVCDYLVQVRRIPAHWVVSAIDAILQGGGRKFNSRARPPYTFPNRYEPQETVATINLSSFSLELETQLALWMQKDGPGPLSTAKLSSGQEICRYSLTGHFVENGFFGAASGNPGARCLGLVLEKKPPTPTPTSELDQMMQRMMRMMGGMFGGEAIRDDVLSNGSPDYVILSCVEFANDWSDDKEQKGTFQMSTKAFEKYSCYYLSLLRTDSWVRIQSGTSASAAFQLRHAKRLN